LKYWTDIIKHAWLNSFYIFSTNMKFSCAMTLFNKS
jgi:hypothetical protein